MDRDLELLDERLPVVDVIVRDEAEALISKLTTAAGEYMDKGILTFSAFETIDEHGVGRLAQIAAAEGRETKPGIKLGVCGEHGGDPESIHFFHKIGLDDVSCSPFRVPVARLESGRAAVTSPPVGTVDVPIETSTTNWGFRHCRDLCPYLEVTQVSNLIR